MKLSPLLLLLYLTTWLCFGSNLRFERISTEHGLSQIAVNSILQDSEGFLWFATQDGLNRYDGVEFKVFQAKNNDPYSIPGNWVHVIFEDSNNNLWIGTSEGLSRFERTTERFKHYSHNKDDPNSLSNNMVMTIAEDQLGDLWIGTYLGGLNRFDPVAEKFSHYFHDANDPNSLGNNRVSTVWVDNNQTVWVGTSSPDLNRFDSKNNNFKRFTPASPLLNQSKSAHGERYIRTLFTDRQNNLWVGSSALGLLKFNPNNHQFTTHLAAQGIASIYQDHNDFLWIGTDQNGLYRLNPQTNELLHSQHHPINPHSLVGNSVRAITQDNSGVLWFGTHTGGLSKYNPAIDQFAHYRYKVDEPDSLLDKLVWSLHQDNQGGIWIGSPSGATRIDPKTNQFSYFRSDSSNPNALSGKHILSIHQDREGFIWFGTGYQGLNRFDPNTQTFTQFRHQSDNDNSLSSSNRISVIFEDSQQNLWVGTNNGLNRFNKNRDQISRFIHDPQNPNSIDSLVIESIFEDSQGQIWIGLYNHGLDLYQPSTGHFKHYRHDPKNPNSLSDNTIYSIHEDPQGILWFGSQNGLNKFNPKTNQFNHYFTEQGLSNNSVMSVMADQQGNLWLTTNKGLNRFNPRTETFDIYTFSDGIQADEFTVGAYALTREGQMLIGGVNGFNLFDPANIISNQTEPKLVFTDFSVNNQKVNSMVPSQPSMLNKTINHTDKIVLKHTDLVISFNFAALHFINPKQNQYAYQLQGFDPQWVYTDALNRRATYTNLNPGHYVFKFKGSNNDNLWSSQTRTIAITVHPAPWRTWWAYSLYSLAILSMLYTLGYLYFKRLMAERHAASIQLASEQKHKAMLESQVKQRTDALQQSLEQLQQTQQQLIEAEKMAALANLVTGVAHEVNTPLGNCITMVSLHLERLNTLYHQFNDGTMSRKALSDYLAQTQQSQSLVADNLNRADDLVQRFKAIAIERGDESNKPIIFHHYLQQIIDSVQVQCQRRAISIGLTAVKHFSVTTCPRAWWQIISNLIENSLQHGFKANQGGSIELSAQLDQGVLRFVYLDDGVGMDQQTCDQLYEPFFTTARSQGNIGLGMHSVYNLVTQKLGGKIHCISQPEQGAVYTIEVKL